MRAREKILSLLKARESDGAMQSEICTSLKLSKSTVSEILKELEAKGEVVKEKIGRAYRVWHTDFAPFPVARVRVGILKAAEYPHVILAAKNLNARIVVFENALKLTRALASGSIDIGFSPLITQVLFGLLLKSIKIHAVVAYNGSGVVSRKEIEEARSFATSELSAMESNLRLFIEKKGLEVEKIRYFSSAERMISAFEQGEFDAVAVWEPYFSKLEGFKYEFRDVIGDFPCCSMASNVAFYNLRREKVVEFKREMERCLKELNDKKAFEALSFFGFGRDVLEVALKRYKFSAEIGRKDVEFLENYGIKLIGENVEKLIDPL